MVFRRVKYREKMGASKSQKKGTDNKYADSPKEICRFLRKNVHVEVGFAENTKMRDVSINGNLPSSIRH